MGARMPAWRRARASGRQATPSAGGTAAQGGVGHRYGAVAVGVGLEHHHHLGPGRPGGQPTDVVGHRRQVDLQPRRPVELDDAERPPGPVLADEQLGGIGAVGQQPLDHPLHPGRRAALDQHHRVGAEVGGHLGRRVLGGEGDGHPRRDRGRPGRRRRPSRRTASPWVDQDVDHLGRPGARPGGAAPRWPTRARPCRRARRCGAAPAARPACPARRGPTGVRRCRCRRAPGSRPARPGDGAVRRYRTTRPTAATASSPVDAEVLAHRQGGQRGDGAVGAEQRAPRPGVRPPSWWAMNAVPAAVTAMLVPPGTRRPTPVAERHHRRRAPFGHGRRPGGRRR